MQPMSPQCPQCHSQQQTEVDSEESSRCCHNCGDAFDSDDQSGIAESGTTQSGQINDVEAVCNMPDQAEKPLSADEEMPPQRKAAHIWPWLLVMLFIVISSGFFMQKEQWLDNRWLRSTAMNLGVAMEKRDKDWLVIAESIRAEWITRTDASRALIIRGRLKNLLTCDLLPPELEISFYAANEPSQRLVTRQLHLTMRPDEQTIKQAPFVRPAPDTMPISPLSQREFTIVMESLPEGVGDFTLTAKAGR